VFALVTEFHRDLSVEPLSLIDELLVARYRVDALWKSIIQWRFKMPGVG